MTVDMNAVSPAIRSHVAKQALAALRVPEPRSVDELATKMEEDYQVQLVKRTLQAVMKAIDVTVSNKSDDIRADELADLTSKLWESTRDSMIDAFSRGRVAYEKIFARQNAYNLLYIESLEALPFSNTKMRLSKQGDFEGIDLLGSSDIAEIDADKSWWLAIDATPLEPHGRSRHLGAPYKVWKDREEVKRLRRLYIKRFVIRGGVIYAPSTARDHNGKTVDNWELIGQAYDNMVSGGVMFFSPERDANGQRQTEWADLPSTLDPSAVDNVLDGMDIEQVRAYGLSEEAIGANSEVGAFARAKLYVMLLFSQAEDLLDQMVTSFQKYVLDKLVEMNWPELSAPEIVISFASISEQPDSVGLELVKALLLSPQLSPVVLSGAVDVAKVLESAGIPMSPDLEHKIKSMLDIQRSLAPQASPGMQPPGAPNQSTSQSPTEFGSLSRMQWKRNVRAIRDVLDDFIKGNSSEAFALQMLQTLGISTDRAAALVADAKDGDIDDGDVNQLGRILPKGAVMALNPNTGKPLIDLAVDPETGKELEFPMQSQAIQFLLENDALTQEEAELLAADETGITGSDDDVTAVRKLLIDAVGRGSSVASFKKKVKKEIPAGADINEETVLRTATKRAYLAGKEETIKKPHIKALFPYVMLSATRDSHVRDAHWELDGKIVRVDDTQAYNVLKRAVEDWNCRCDLIPMTEKQVEGKRVFDYSSLPSLAKAQYG